ncbi:hypothetical protein GCM10010836_00130 [Aminobacter aminovorans]
MNCVVTGFSDRHCELEFLAGDLALVKARLCGQDVVKRCHAEPSAGPQEDALEHRETPGSWWPEWTDWLDGHSTPPAKVGEHGFGAIGSAPGTYVYEK